MAGQHDHDEIRKRSIAGCLLGFAVLAFFGVLLLAAYYSELAAQAERKREQKQRREESFALVRAGQNHVLIHEPELLELLASDPNCVANLTSIDFAMADLSDPAYAQVRKLANVRRVVFYDVEGLRNILQYLSKLPAVETLSFESVRLDDESIKLLRSFPELRKVQFAQILSQTQLQLLATQIPHAEIEVEDPESGELVPIPNSL